MAAGTQNIWQGGTTAVAQVDTFTPATVEVDDIFTLTATAEDGTTTNAVSVTCTAGADEAARVANVCTLMANEWNNSSNILMTGITATDNTTTVSLTADTAGVPFSVASTETDGGGADTQTFTRAATTANAGPNDWNTAGNWSDGTVPVAEDVMISGTYDILYGLNQSAVTPASIVFGDNFTGACGNTEKAYYLQIGSAASIVVNSAHKALWLDSSPGSGTIINRTGGGGNAAQLKGDHSSLRVAGINATGTITLADGASSSSKLYLLGAPGAKLLIGDSGGSISNVAIDSGSIEINTDITNLDVYGGTITTKGTVGVNGAGAEIVITGGTLRYQSTGTLTLLSQWGGTTEVGPFESGAVLTITAITMEGGTLREIGSSGQITWPVITANSSNTTIQTSATSTIGIDQ